jgi:hypothetical protein
MVKSKDQKYKEDIDNAIKAHKKYKQQCRTLERIYAGEYSPMEGSYEDRPYPSFGGETGGGVKTNKMFEAVEEFLAIIMPNTEDVSVTIANNQKNTNDVLAAKTADSLLTYALENGLYSAVEDAVRNYRLMNSGYILHWYLPDDLSLGEGVESPVEYDLVMPHMEDNTPGHPTVQSLHPMDVVRSIGYKSIREAWSEGGMVAYRFWAHIDWVKSKKKQYKNINKIRADVQYKGEEPKSRLEDYAKDNDTDSMDPEYCELWAMFYGPTQKDPEGKFVIYSQTQNLVMYEHSGRVFKGLRVPIVEISELEPRRGYQYATPTAYKALNPMFEYEYYETDILNRIEQSQDILFTVGDFSDNAESMLNNPENKLLVITPDDAGNYSDVKNMLQHVQVNLDIQPSEIGSARALSRFEDMMGSSLTRPRVQGGEIATEMVIENRKEMEKVNRKRFIVGRFLRDNCRAWLKIAKEKMSTDEQVRITRQVDRTWRDDDRVTLDGDYVVDINIDNMLDMTEGERMKSMQMGLTVGANISQNPRYADRVDMIPVLKEYYEGLNMATSEIFAENTDIDQWHEISMALIFFNMPNSPIEVEPDDDHPGHMRTLHRFFTMLEQNNGTIHEDAEVILRDHFRKHAMTMKKQSQGSAGLDDIPGAGEGPGGENISSLVQKTAGGATGGGYAGISNSLMEAR